MAHNGSVNIDGGSAKVFFTLLRAGLYGIAVPAAELPAVIDWQEVMALALKHAVAGVVIDSVQYLPEGLRPPAPLAARMSQFAMRLIQSAMVLDRAVGRLVTFFSEHGVSGVLLKGQGVARYYRQPQMRHTGDIDFYVGHTLYNKAVRLCLENLVGDKAGCQENMLHFNFDLGGVEVELHRRASRISSSRRNRRFQEWTVEQLERSPRRRTLALGGAQVTLPPVDFDALFIFQHAWRHYLYGGIGLRQLCDWAMIFHSHASEIDTPRLIANIRRFGLTGGWKIFAFIAVRYLGVDPDRMPLYDPSYRRKGERVLRHIFEGGNFGHHTAGSSRYFPDGHSPGALLAKLRIISRDFTILFPLVPSEATALFFFRLRIGIRDTFNRLLSK